MRLALALLVIAGCEKQSGVETSPGSGSSAIVAAPVITSPDASLGTTPNDAVVAKAPADAAVAVARRDVRALDSIAIDRDATLKLIEAMSADDKSRLDVDSSRRRPGADLQRQVDAIRDGNKLVAIGGGSRGDGDPRVGTGGGGAISTGAPKDVDPSTPSGRVSVGSKQAFDESTLTPDVVLAKIQSAYVAGIKRCYKTYLKQDPAARGKIKLSITVNQTGRAVASRASGFAKEIDDCVTGLMASWRFPVPKDRDGESTDASFAIDLTLVPD